MNQVEVKYYLLGNLQIKYCSTKTSNHFLPYVVSSTHGSDNKSNNDKKFIKLVSFCSVCKLAYTCNNIFKIQQALLKNAEYHKYKNKLPHILPNGILLKIFGSVIKAKLGP